MLKRIKGLYRTNRLAVIPVATYTTRQGTSMREFAEVLSAFARIHEAVSTHPSAVGAAISLLHGDDEGGRDLLRFAPEERRDAITRAARAANLKPVDLAILYGALIECGRSSSSD